MWRVPRRASRSVISTRGCYITRRAISSRRAIGAGPWGLRGLPGLTNHQTPSNPKRRSASRVIWAWPACAGSNDPPSKPTRMPGNAIGNPCRTAACPMLCSKPLARRANLSMSSENHANDAWPISQSPKMQNARDSARAFRFCGNTAEANPCPACNQARARLVADWRPSRLVSRSKVTF